MENSNTLSKVSTFTFIGMTCALAVSIRNIPDVAATGWTMLTYMLIGVLFYAYPICLIAGEFAGMFPEDGGMELWVTKALGKKWGFVVSWLLWVQMFPGMVMIASALTPLIGIVIGNPQLGESNKFTFAVILVVYWAITLLNLKYDMTKFGGKIGVWFGLYIPLMFMLLLGIAATIKLGLNPDSLLGSFQVDKLFPDEATGTSLKYLAPVMFIFTGIEMSSVHVKRLNNPAKTYIKGIMVALIFMFFLNVINAFMVANVVNKGTVELNNIAQSIELYLKVLGLPTYLVSIFSAMVLIGVLVQLSAWVCGPSKTITSSARRGLYPPKFKFWKTNSIDVSPNVLLTQAIVISLFAFFYLIIPEVNEAFLMLVSATAVIYGIAYIIMGVSIIKLRKESPNLNRPFSIGSMTKVKVVVGILLISILLSFILTLLYSNMTTIIAVIAITVVLFGLPFIINERVKPTWATDIQAQLDKNINN